jgi:hypothetical protein
VEFAIAAWIHFMKAALLAKSKADTEERGLSCSAMRFVASRRISVSSEDRKGFHPLLYIASSYA